MKVKTSEASGITILLIGIALLAVTFIIAYVHLQEGVDVLPVPSLMGGFGDALSPLLEAVIRVIYLGLMGWIASKVAAKGITVLLSARKIRLFGITDSPQSPKHTEPALKQIQTKLGEL